MKKLIAITLTFAVSLLSSVALGAQPAIADSRVSGSVTGKTVFIGSPSTVSTTATLSDRAATAEWANFKYEVVAVQKASFSILAVYTQQNTAPCGGTTSSPSGSSVTCTVALTTTRNVLYATNAMGTGVFSNSVKITQTAGDSQLFRVRGWVDRNNNNQIDPYEPSTTVQSINTVDPQKAKAYYNFEVDPPRYTDGKVTGWIANGGASNKATDLMDPTLVTMKVHSCSLISCTRVSGATTYNYHPQLLRYEFSTAVPSLTLGTYAVELYYQQSPSINVLLDTRTFDYKSRAPLGVKTEIVPQGGTAEMPSGMSAGTIPSLKTTIAGPGLSAFTYKATFTDADKTLIANRAVYVIFNATDLVNSNQLRVNGLQVSSSNQDLIIIRRVTDANGVLTLNIQYPGRALEQLKIDLQVNGFRTYEFAYPGSEEAILWDTTPVRTISLSASGTSATSTSPFTLTAFVGGKLGGGAVDGSVIFYGDSAFTFDSPVAPLGVGTSATTVVRISNFADETGTGFVYAQALSESGWITAKLQLSWKEFGGQVVVGTMPTAIIETPTNSVPTDITTSATATIEMQTQSKASISNLKSTDKVAFTLDGQTQKPVFTANRSSASILINTTNMKPRKVQIILNGKTILSGNDQTQLKVSTAEISATSQVTISIAGLSKADKVIVNRDGQEFVPIFSKLGTSATKVFVSPFNETHKYNIMVNGKYILNAATTNNTLFR